MRSILVGFGFLGRSFGEVLWQKSEVVKKVDKDFKVIGVSDINGFVYNDKGLNLRKLSSVKRIAEYPNFLEGKSSIELIERANADIMIEVTPTNIEDGEPGLTHINSALKRGTNVVTANKGPLVLAFVELMKLARKNGVEIKYEATVAGAIPIFSLVNKCLQGDRIKKISGILNGTSNYILSKMYSEGTSFEMVLKEAQERGIAEKDPHYDVEGIDAACKVVILANSLMKRNAKFKDVEKVGISRITPEAISLAKEAGYMIKQIGTVDGTLEVSPKLIPVNHPLCVNGALNALYIKSDLAREITIVGYGAGRETASAILNDMISIIKMKKPDNS